MGRKYFRTGASFVAVAFLIAAVPAEAQTSSQPGSLAALAAVSKRVDVSGSTGLSLPTDWSDLVLLGSVSSATGTVEQVLARDLVVDPGQVFDAAVTYWEGRYGFRVHGGFAESCLAVGRHCGNVPGGFGAQAGSVDVDAWVYDIGGAIGLIEHSPGRWAWPFVFFGVGGVTYDLQRTVGPPLTFIERRPVAGQTQRVVVVSEEPEPLLVTVDELGVETKLAFNFGVATDLRVPLGPASFGLRLEVGDYIHASPIDIRVVNPEVLTRFGNETRLDFGWVHNLRAAAGLVLQFGR